MIIGQNAQFLQHHLQKECPLENISCKFSFAGCQVQIERKSIKEHLDESKDEHLEMTASECKNIGAECKNLGTQLANLMLAFTKISPNPVFIPPPDIVMTNFESKQKGDERWYNPPFYTHIGGYKMCLRIGANGWGSGEGTHVGVGVYMMKGEFDSHLKWPFKGEITVELVNQKEGGKKCEGKPITHERSSDVFQRVKEGERANSGWGLPKFISHSDLYKPEDGKEYLVNDTLIFRVTNVEVTSI